MTETKRKKRKSIFRALLIILLMSSVLVAVFLFATLFLRTETFYQYYLGKELELSAKRAADNVASFLRQGQESIEKLAKDPVLLSELEKQENASKPKIFQIVNRVVAEESINPIIHIVTTDRQSIISTDYSIERYNPNHYAGLSHIFYDTDQTITLANSFVSGNGESVVLTIARQMFKGGNHLGYIYFDITEKEIENVIKAKEKIELTNYVPYVNYIVFTWYKYQLFNNSMIQPIHTQADSNYLRSSFTELFSQESAKILTFDSEDGSDFLIASEKSADGELIVLSTVALNLLQKNINNMTLSVTTILSILILFFLIFVLWINRSIRAPVKEIVRTMTAYGQGDHTARCVIDSDNEFGLIKEKLNEMIANIDLMMKSNLEKQDQLILAENNFLKAQVRPHFINNVLETIHWTIKTGDNDVAANMIRNLGKIMTERVRADSSAFETVEASLRFTNWYLEIQKQCYPTKINYQYFVEEDVLDWLIPTYLVQPLVENAVIHGLQPKVDNGMLAIHVFKVQTQLYIVVADNGMGFDCSKMQAIFSEKTIDGGIGLININRRLKLYYGDLHGLQIASEPGAGTTITVRIPEIMEAD